MAYPSYNPVDPFDPLGDAGTAGTLYQSPASYSQTWGQYHGDLGSPEIEMGERRRPGGPEHRASGNSQYSTTPTLFPSNTSNKENETESFLRNKIDHTYTINSVAPYKDHTTRQLRHILVGSSFRFAITALLCIGYVVSAKLWQHKGIQSETQKRVYNTLTTGMSLALSLNIASSFKDMALNMRWPILSAKRRSLEEVDLILHADSMMKLAKLAFTARRPIIVLTCASWLFINILAQAGVAMLSLTYNWDTDRNAVLTSNHLGEIAVANMSDFKPGETYETPQLYIQDQEYTAHLYGGLAFANGIKDIQAMPKSGDIYNSTGPTLWSDDSRKSLEYVFLNYPLGTSGHEPFSMYSDRTVNVTYVCESHKVTQGGDSLSSTANITVDAIGEVDVYHSVENSTTFFTNMVSTETPNRCGNNQRCTIVEAFEVSDTDPWYYKCNITVGMTLNDPLNVSFISDDMAFKGGSAIGQIGYTDQNLQESQIYPRASFWGTARSGNAEEMGKTIATFALGSIAGAALYNPTKTVRGIVPSQGFVLQIGHQYFFYTIVGLIMGCHLLFCIIVAILSNRVMVGPDGHLEMSLLLRPIADSLEGVSAGKKNSAYKSATKNYTARYEKARSGRWILNMT